MRNKGLMHNIANHNSRNLGDQCAATGYGTRAYQCLERPSVVLVRIVVPRLYERHWTRVSRELGMQQRRTDLQADYMRII